MLKGRCALVTGSNGGIGHAIARSLAEQGCDIALNGVADPAQVEPARAALEADFGIQARYFRTDLARQEEVPGMVAAIEAELRPVDILVNNAVVRYAAPIEEFAVDQWNHALAVNLSAAFLAIKYTMPGMKRRNWGRIVNISSVHGLFGTVGRIDYVATKTALLGVTKSVALEARSHNITCNAICPGSVLTPHSDGKVRQLMAKEGLSRAAAEAKFLADRGHARFVAASSIGAFIVFLCGAAGRDINGAVVPIDAGYSAGHVADLGGGGAISTAAAGLAAAE
jgi:3-hydroxybutyrate dehydrogenase